MGHVAHSITALPLLILLLQLLLLSLPLLLLLLLLYVSRSFFLTMCSIHSSQSARHSVRHPWQPLHTTASSAHTSSASHAAKARLMQKALQRLAMLTPPQM